MLLGKNVAPLPPLENFQIRQTMCNMLIVTFSNMADNMATNDQAIVNPPASFRSAVWKYYGFPTKDGTTDKSKTICKICLATFKYCAGSTSSMSAHLKSQHSIDEKSEVLQSKTAKTSPGTKNSTGTGQSKIQDVMKNKLPRSGNRATAITKSIGVFIAKDMRPYSVVENKGFQHMINVLEPRYDLPSRVYFSEKVIPKLYEEVKAEVESDLKNAEFVALTSDGWTSRSTESYITVTAHFIQEWNIKNYVLQTRRMDESHTSENLSKILTSAISEWNLQRYEQNPSLTSDNASNIVNAAKQAELSPHVGCVAHTINLATQRGLKVSQMDRLLGRIRRIASFFHRSTTAMAVLKSKQSLLELPQHKLINDVPTRWNSSYDMVQQFLEQQTAIEAVLLTKDVKKNAKDVHFLSENDISAAESVIKVLGPIKTITTILCDEKTPTVSMIHPLKEMLIQQLKVSDDDIMLVKEVKTAIAKDLDVRAFCPK